MSYVSKLKEMKESFSYNREELDKINSEIEQEIGSSEMWKTVSLVFELDEYLENLIYIAEQNDLQKERIYYV